MKIDLRRLTLAALVLSTSATYNAVASAQSFVGDADADYYGALGGFVPDAENNELSDNVVAATEGREVWGKGAIDTPGTPGVRQVAASMYIGDDVIPASQTASPSDQSSASSQYQATSHDRLGAYASSAGGGNCDSNCDSGLGGIGSAICADDPSVWMKAELLLWFPQGRNTPPLGVRSAQGEVPLLNSALAPSAVPFGDSFGGGLVPGFRGDIGRYFADGAFGIGGRVWVLGDDKETLNFGGAGIGESFGVPFFNTNPAPLVFGENSIFSGFNDGDPVNQGSVAVRSSLSIVAAEIYGRALVSKSKNHRFEMLGGYSHFNIADSLDINVQSIGLPAAELTVFNDSFRTRNEFHGGQIGSEISLSKGRWTASSLTKVHLGNMSQRINVSGTTAQSNFPANPVVVAPDQGLFARGEVRDLDGFKRDVFAFAPEMNLKLGYQFRDHVNLHVGYTFVYWNNVALAGDQINRNIYLDTANFNANDTARHVSARSSGYFVQGIDLGATIEF